MKQEIYGVHKLRAASIAAVVAAAVVVTAHAADSVTAEKGWADVTRCAREDTERARHTCVDRVLRDAGLITNQMDAQQQRRAFGLGNAPAPAAVTPAPAPAPAPAPVAAARVAPTTPAPASPATPAARSAATPAAPAGTDPDKLDVEIAAVKKGLDGYLLVTTTEGAVWRQGESVNMALPPEAGDHMTIRKGSLGGYRCSLTQTHVTFRCARSK